MKFERNERFEEVYVPREWIKQHSNIDGDVFSLMTSRYGVKSDNGAWPLFEVVKALRMMSKRGGGDAPESKKLDLEVQKKEEEILKLKIANGEKLNELVEVETIKDRVRISFQAVASKIRYAIKSISPRLLGINDSALLIEEMLTKAYNSALNELNSEEFLANWEEENKNKLRRTQLVENPREDSRYGNSGDAEDTSER